MTGFPPRPCFGADIKCASGTLENYVEQLFIKSFAMLARLSLPALICVLTVVGISSCEDETKNNSLALVGRWQIVEGFRNQKPTQTLAGTYFQFGDDGKMQTNLPIGPEEPMDYQVSGNEIRQKSVPPIKYMIQNINDSALVLSLELRGMQFVLHLQRSAPASDSIPGLPAEQGSTTSPVDTTLTQ